jgi:hypothetical protein
MADSSIQSIVIDASPEVVAAVICDFRRYPEWADAVKSVEVLQEYEDGYASEVRFVLDAGVLADESRGSSGTSWRRPGRRRASVGRTTSTTMMTVRRR